MILSKWLSPTRLETRTKESNTYASLRVTETHRHNESKYKVLTYQIVQHQPSMIFCEWHEEEHNC